MSSLASIVVVGGSLAGLRAAEALRQQGFEGRLSFVGAEKHRPYDRPPLSKEILRGDWEPQRASLVRGDGFDALELDLHLGRRATGLDLETRRITLDDSSVLEYAGLVIATGADARPLPGTPDLRGIHTLRTLDDCLAIRAGLERAPRVAVVGAGFIGAEVAASCRERGLDVTLVEALPVPLGRVVGDDVGAAVAGLHRERGVDLRLGVGVESFLGEGRVSGLLLADGSKVAADLVVVGIGVAPAIDWLRNSGLELGNGVVCDETCATSAPGVVAAGDVAEWPHPLFDERMRIEHWSNAGEQARHAANTLLGGRKGVAFESIPFFWSDQYDVKIQSAGRLADADESQVVHGSIEERKFVKLYGRKGRLVGALAFNEPRRLIQLRRKLREGPSFESVVSEMRSGEA